MKKLIGVLFIASACVPAAAQQDNKPSSGASAAALQNEQVLPIRPGFKIPIEFQATKGKTEPARRTQFPPEAFVVTQPQWVFKDGAVYIDILGTGTLIPVPGGGASGCFDADLRERIEKMRSRVEALPPLPR